MKFDKLKLEMSFQLLDNINIQMWILHDIETYSFVNKACADFLGKDKKSIENKKIWDILYPKEAQICIESNIKAFKEKKETIVEEWVKNSKGQSRLLSITKIPVLDESNNVKYIICKAEDITKNKHNKEELKIDEKKYSVIVETQKNLICRFLPDTTLTFVNKAYCDYFNVKYNELIGTKFLKLVPRKDHGKVLEKLASFSVKNNSTTYEHRVIDANNKERWHRWTDTAFFNENGEIAELQSIGTDITKLKRREENLLNNYDKIEKEVKQRTEEVKKINEKLKMEIEERKLIEEKLNKNIELLKKSFDSSINVVLQIMNIRDPYTVNHQQRVGYLAYSIGKELGLPKEKLNSIYIAGILHDIGKIYVPSEFLSKPGKLNKVEFDIIKAHPQVGYDILSKIKFPWPIDTIVLQHHERINGSGYPYKLMDNEILLEAKIIAVADVVEAMSSHRPYRPALDEKLALEEIGNNKGVFYDTDVVDVCLKLFNEKQFHFEKEKLDLMDLIELK